MSRLGGRKAPQAPHKIKKKIKEKIFNTAGQALRLFFPGKGGKEKNLVFCYEACYA
jgi:hypothetical protein